MSVKLKGVSTPEEHLWLAIIDRTPEYRDMPNSRLRCQLLGGGFPERVIEAVLDQRRQKDPKEG